MNERYVKFMEWRRPMDWFGFGFPGGVLMATRTLALLTGETHDANSWKRRFRSFCYFRRTFASCCSLYAREKVE